MHSVPVGIGTTLDAGWVVLRSMKRRGFLGYLAMLLPWKWWKKPAPDVEIKPLYQSELRYGIKPKNAVIPIIYRRQK
jgi:hypothetical protein